MPGVPIHEKLMNSKMGKLHCSKNPVKIAIRKCPIYGTIRNQF
jgi:hypothetical protein